MSTTAFELFIISGRNEVVAKVIFLHLSVILFTGGGSASVRPGKPPPWEAHPQEAHPPGSTPPPEADSGIRSMSGRYASYWNAFYRWLKENHFSGYFRLFATKILGSGRDLSMIL